MSLPDSFLPYVPATTCQTLSLWEPLNPRQNCDVSDSSGPRVRLPVDFLDLGLCIGSWYEKVSHACSRNSRWRSRPQAACVLDLAPFMTSVKSAANDYSKFQELTQGQFIAAGKPR